MTVFKPISVIVQYYLSLI